MTLVIGIDEAGYGPNLGPLVIGGSSWQIDDLQSNQSSTDVAEQFLELQNDIQDDYRAGQGPPWGDSKKIFTRRGTKSETLEPLERGVFAAVRIATDTLPATSEHLLSLLTLTPPDDSDLACWKKLNTLRLPLATEVPRAIKESDKAARQLQNHSIRLTGLACRWIFPETFNAALNTGLNKSDILSQTSLQLAFDLRNQHPDSPAVIWCDRHGGRKRYTGVVSHCFDAARVEPLSETTHHSHYYIHDCEHPTSIHFSVGGESQLPVAVASMTAKYTRELAMDVFNKFWTDKLPSLQPTAGYPVDAQRWWKETEKNRRGMNIKDDALWRKS